MSNLAIPTDASCRPCLVGADFGDAYAIDVPDLLDAPEATRRAFANMPGWFGPLLALRNMLVRPFGLKTRHDSLPQDQRFGMFPVVLSTPSRVVLGFDDRHLDFRIVVDVGGQGHRVSVTTLVRRHGWMGRAYLAVVLPFHRLIVPACLRRVAA